MNVAKWLLLMLLALPMAELVAFIAVATAYGFFQALGLLLLGTLAGIMVLRHAGGNHIARVRMAMNQGVGRESFTALRADGTSGLMLVGGILLVIPGFITDFLGLLVLLAPFWGWLKGALGHPEPPPARDDGVVDLAPEQWRRVDDPRLPPRQPQGSDRSPEGHPER